MRTQTVITDYPTDSREPRLRAPLTPGDFLDANDVSLRYLIGRREDKTEMLTLLTASVFQMLPEGIVLTFLHGPDAQP